MESSRNGSTNGSGYPPLDAAEQFLRDAKQTLAPILAREIPADLLRYGHEAELKQRVGNILDDWLKREKVPIGRQLRLKLLESITADLGRK
jgi:hypothetical protein